METYTRKLSVRELKIIGPNWQERLNQVIGHLLTSTSGPDTAGSRVLTIMSDGEPVNIAAIKSAYDLIHGTDNISTDYLRLTVRTLWIAGKIRKIARGVYQKVG